MDRSVDRPGFFGSFARRHMNGAIDLGRISVNRNVTSRQGQNYRYRGDNSIAIRRAHKLPHWLTRPLLYQHRRGPETSRLEQAAIRGTLFNRRGAGSNQYTVKGAMVSRWG